MLETLGEKIHDGRFLRLVSGMLSAGYLEDWVWNATLSGIPQGGPASPILSNIYLDRLDKFVEMQLLPSHNRGERRAPNLAYHGIKRAERRVRRNGNHAAARALRLRSRELPSGDPRDPGYRRLRYVRYADDILLGFSGPKAEAMEIKHALGRFLGEELKLELSEAKTLVTHAQTGKARFLGYDIMTQQANTKITRGQRAVNGSIGLLVPKDAITRRCVPYMRKGKPECRPQMFNDDDYTIISQYQAEYRGVVQYYLLANDVYRLNRLSWVMGTSLLKTLAGKHKSTVSKMARRYKAVIQTPEGPRTCFRTVVERGEEKKPLVAWFGGIPLKRQTKAAVNDRAPILATTKGNELISRLVAGCCELCGATERLEVHHIRKLADLNKPGRREKPAWVQTMARRRRKTLVLCRPCHEKTHAGRPNAATQA
jgi:AI2M/AI1M-like, HNH endonuclease/Type II intron maturase/Reverse transcriptase (RNA-dependent DNA polymerase)